MTDELPPLWALDMAAKAAGCGDWDHTFTASEAVIASIIAHARTLAKHETPPVDPAEEQRWKDAREAARHSIMPAKRESLLRGEMDYDCCAQSAYIALCNRDGVTPNLEGGK